MGLSSFFKQGSSLDGLPNELRVGCKGVEAHEDALDDLRVGRIGSDGVQGMVDEFSHVGGSARAGCGFEGFECLQALAVLVHGHLLVQGVGGKFFEFTSEDFGDGWLGRIVREEKVGHGVWNVDAKLRKVQRSALRSQSEPVATKEGAETINAHIRSSLGVRAGAKAVRSRREARMGQDKGGRPDAPARTRQSFSR